MTNRFALTAAKLWGYLLLSMVVILLPATTGAATLTDYLSRMQKLVADSQYQEAVRVMGEAATTLTTSQDRQQALMQQGDIYYYYLEDYQQALASYQAAYDAAPKTKTAADALYRRGLIYLDKLNDKNAAVKDFEVVLNDFPQFPKRDELKRLLKGTLSRSYKLDLIERKNYWKFYICLIDGLIIFFWKVLHEYAAAKKSRGIMVDVGVTLLIILNITVWWIVMRAEAQLDMLAIGIIK